MSSKKFKIPAAANTSSRGGRNNKQLKRRQAGFLTSALSHLGAAYAGYRAPRIFSNIKQGILNTAKKLPFVKKYAEYNQNKAREERLAANAKLGREQFDAIKKMNFNPFGPKQEQIDMGTRGMFGFRDKVSKQWALQPRDMTVDTAKEVADRFKVDPKIASQLKRPIKPYDPNAVFNTYEDAVSGMGMTSRNAIPKQKIKRLAHNL